MKTTPQIEDDIKARQAELQSLVSRNQQMVQQFQQQMASDQKQANFLEGQIAALTGLLPKPKRQKPSEKESPK